MTAALIWAALKPWLKSFNVWLVLAIAGMGVVIWIGNGKLRERNAEAASSKAVATNATATVKAATATATAERAATDATPLPADKQAILDLCRKSASCRERGQK